MAVLRQGTNLVGCPLSFMQPWIAFLMDTKYAKYFDRKIIANIKYLMVVVLVASVPILVQVMPDLPAYVPIGLSAAFTALDVGIEIRKEQLELKQNPLYFTIKLKKVVKKQKNKK